MQNEIVFTPGMFEDLLDEHFMEPVEKIKEKKRHELVYMMGTANPDIDVYIHSTIHTQTGKSNPKWKAIKVTCFDTLNARTIKTERFLRKGSVDRLIVMVKNFIENTINNLEQVPFISWEYVKAVLEATPSNEFVDSLKNQLEQRGTLTNKQLAYIVGDRTPNNRPTMEAELLRRIPNFRERFERQRIQETGTAPEMPGRFEYRGTVTGRIRSQRPNFQELARNYSAPTQRHLFEQEYMGDWNVRRPRLNIEAQGLTHPEGLSGLGQDIHEYELALRGANGMLRRRFNSPDADDEELGAFYDAVQRLQNSLRRINTNGKVLVFDSSDNTFKLVMPDDATEFQHLIVARPDQP
ncbi:MAG: hypothetical protein DRJ03_01135 [Chloroflexi bacterium]|nr:MAG: hypothetical protein DRJ03_01135 [Chloroflexota bacterium]